VTHNINRLNAIAIGRGDINVADAKGEHILWQQIEIFPTVTFIYCGDVRGNVFGAGKIGGKKLQTWVSNSSTQYVPFYYNLNAQGNRTQELEKDTKPFDPRVRPWYKAAVAAGQPTWSDIYLVVPTFDPAIAASLPIYNARNRSLIAVCATDILLPQQMSQFLRSLNIGKTGHVFIMERSGQLVATSTDKPMTSGRGENTKRLFADQSSNPLIQVTAKHLRDRFGNFNQIQTSKQFDFKINSKRQLVQVTPFKDGYGLSWLIVTVIPESDFMEQIHKNTRNTILLCLVALIGAIVFCILATRWITQPILRLNQSAKALAKGEWQQIVNVERSDELGELARSFNSMTRQLQVSFNDMKALNEALSQSEKRFQLIAQVTNDAIWDWDLLTDYAWWNTGIQTIFGYTVDEIEFHINWWRERIHPEDRKRVISGTSHVLDADSTEQFWFSEYRFRRVDGSYVYVTDRGFVIRDHHGKPIRMIGGMTDITQRKQMEELLEDYNQTLKQQVTEQTVELAREKESLQVIIDYIPVMITVYDARGRVQFVNRELEQCLGWSSAELEEIDLLGECHPNLEQRQQVLEHMLAATGKWLDIKTRTKDERYIDTSWANIRLSNGITIGIGQDISDRKRAEEASILDERNRMAREIHDTLAQAFTGILLHIGAATELITKKPATAQAHLKTVDELARTGLAEARRSVAALRPKLLEEGDLSSALKRLTAQMKSSTNTYLTCAVIGTAYPLSPDVENNLLRIGQEALTNAVKYAQATEIQVELVYDETQCLLRVKDNGQGFEVAQICSSNGFGLLGMSERAEHIGGELIIHSQPTQGTQVIVIVNRE
jgi:PAS domain S-box-containing protein